MWNAIVKKVDFIDKTVLDAGCGHGDLVMYAWMSGAKAVVGVDKDKIALTDARLRAGEMILSGARITFVEKDIEQWDSKWPGKYDIVFCTSVLPYLLDPDRLLANICNDSKIAIIECQYAGDGPGFTHIANDEQMLAWLQKFCWTGVARIGQSYLASRDLYRSIWMCNR